MEKETQTWRKVLQLLSMICLLAAAIALTFSTWPESHEHDLSFNPRWIVFIGDGIYFTLQGILNWKAHRKLAIFELGTVAFVLVMTAYITLIR